jgi:flagellar biosynthesis/type III secretory pathway protein FliH
MNAPLARFLTEFTGDKPDERVEEQPVADVIELPEPECEPEPEPTEPMVTLTVAAYEDALREARETAAARERAEADARMAARLEETRATFSREFAAARETWADREGRGIAASLTSGIARLEADLVAAAADALRPILGESSRARVIAAMRVALAAILSDPDHPPVRVEGPADLLRAIAAGRGEETGVAYVVAEHAEATIVTDSTRIETRLAACLAAFHDSEG